MLALKSMRMHPLAMEHATKFQELPSEMLDLIAAHLYETGFGQAETLLAFSLVSRQFRWSALPFLFNTATHVVRDRLDQCEHGFLPWLLNHPHLLRHVQHVHILRPPDIRTFIPSLDQAGADNLTLEHRTSDLRVLKDSLPWMDRLRRIR